VVAGFVNEEKLSYKKKMLIASERDRPDAARRGGVSNGWTIWIGKTARVHRGYSIANERPTSVTASPQLSHV